MKKQITLLVCLMFTAATLLQAQYQLNGSAIQTDEDCFQLTPALNSQAGSMWYLETVSLNESFTLDFDIFLGCVDGNGADGMYFVLQPISTSLGGIGGGIGFLGITPSLGIEFDTWQNTAYNDPTYDHLAIQQNGDLTHNGPNNLAPPVPISASSNNVEDCVNHNMRIVWNAETQTISVYFDCNLRISYTGDIVNTIFGGDPDVYWGFTAGTGAANNVHAVCLDYISFTDQLTDTNICPGQSLPLSVPTGFEVYIWEPTDGLSNPNIPNPIATPSQTTTYTVTVIDECGNDFFDQITISIDEEPVVNLGPDGFVCENQEILLNATTAGNNTYLWQDGSTNPLYTISHSGQYWVAVSNNCFTVTDTINFAPLVVDYAIDLGPDVTICQGETALLASNITDDINYLWSTGATTQTLSVLEAGVYTLTISSDCGVGIDSVSVSVTPNVSVELGDANQTLCLEDTNVLNAFSDAATGYLWQDGSTNPTFLVTQTGIYAVTVSNECGTATDLVCVVVQSCSPQCDNMSITHIVDCEPTTQNYSVYAAVNGGVAPYTVTGSYSGVINEENTVINFGPFSPGSNYQLSITDAEGCVRSVLGKPSCNTLPVELLSFTGQVLPDANQLQWRVASETNCAYYTLMASANGNQFTTIAQTGAAGNTSIAQQYAFLHQNPPAGITYYRLSQTDFDGTEQVLGNVALQRAVATGSLQITSLLPIPAKNEVQLQYQAANTGEALQLRVYSITGQLVLSQTLPAASGLQTLSLNLNNLSSGIYMLSLSNNSEICVHKLVKE